VKLCGIVGYIGHKNATDVLINSLLRLEYRGYDSSGIGVITDHEIIVKKTDKDIAHLRELCRNLKGKVGVGHTRWATHGKPSVINAHPHVSDGVAVVHNGIIENYLFLKQTLMSQGYQFISDTDTEVIAHLIHHNIQKGSNFFNAVLKSIKSLQGSFALAIIYENEPDKIVAVRKDSPLVIGVGEKEMFISSDIPAILPYTKKVIQMMNDEVAIVKSDDVSFFDISGNTIVKTPTTVEWDIEAAEKAGYEHFMLREIHEQSTVVEETYRGRLYELEGVKLEEIALDEIIDDIKKIVIIGCGTSYHAGLLGKYIFERLCLLHTDVWYASEFRYAPVLVDKNTLSIAITQSGETADTKEAIKNIKAHGFPTLAITNVVGSSITHEVDYVFYTRAGPEVGVAATKTFTAQVIALLLLAIYFGAKRNTISQNKVIEYVREIKRLPSLIRKVLE